MPTINKIQRKTKSTERKETDMRKLRQKAYQTTKWRKIREVYMHEHPICERCIQKGIVTPAEDIHHIISPFKGGQINWEKLFDYENLMALCKECHAEIHNAQQGHVSPEEILKQLDDLLNPEIRDEDLE
jgi:5-methylcytosine-specific restriction protein A